MPTRPGKPCAAPDCKAIVRNARYCALHQAPEVDDRPSASSRGYGVQWRRVRARVLAMRPLCAHCLAKDLIVPATEVDHIKSLRSGGTNHYDNLQSLCKPCHSRKTRRQGVVK